MLKINSPLAYFGNREQHIEDFLPLLREARQRHGRPFSLCYDLFAGSASISLQLIAEENFAEKYVLNDIYPPLKEFWQQVRDDPDMLITAYEELTRSFFMTVLDQRQQFYDKLQWQFNQKIEQTVSQKAANFAFIINHAQHGIPLLKGNESNQVLDCMLDKTIDPLVCDKEFAFRVKQIYELFQTKQIILSDQRFDSWLDKVTSSDLIILDLPYPDTPNVQEDSKLQLQEKLQTYLATLAEQDISFIMFYGVLGMPNNYPISWPQGHMLYLTGEKHDFFGEHVEHLYLSPNLATIFIESNFQDKIQPCFHRIFETQAYQGSYKNGDRTAIVWLDQKWTYAEINLAANRLANYMLDHGLAKRIKKNRTQSKDTLVTLYLNRGPQLIISILAVMKTGAAFLPLDGDDKHLSVSAASERIIQSHTDYLLTDSYLFEKLEEYSSFHSLANVNSTSEAINKLTLQVIAIERTDLLFMRLTEKLNGQSDKEKNLNKQIQPQDLAYVMYTSGSTGQPKGVEVLHRGLPYAFESHQDLLNLGCHDRIAQFASIGFDASLMEIMMALGTGAELHLVPDAVYEDAGLLAKFLKEHQITVAIQTPKMLTTLSNSDDFPALRAFLIVGENFSKDLVNKWLQRIVNGHPQLRQIVNGYGLTETTICTSLELINSINDKPLTIGKAILGCNIHLRPEMEEMEDIEKKENTISNQTQWLNAINQNENTTEGQRGAMYISGPCLARGYWQRPDLTKQRFKSVRLSNNEQVLYQSGDIGYFAYRTGEIIVMGRLDRQVKIRAQRVELDEIEKTLLEVSQGLIQEVRIVAHEVTNEREVGKQTQTNLKVLAAYLVPVNPELVIQDPKQPSAESLALLREIRQRLLSKLPNFMCPSIANLLLVAALPRKGNDKKSYDDVQIKKQWPIPCLVLPLQIASARLNTDAQHQLTIIRQCMATAIGLNVDLLGDDHNFYEIGGDSLSVKWFLESLRKLNFSSSFFSKAAKELTVQTFDSNPTVEGVWQTLNWLVQQQQQREQLWRQTFEDDAIPFPRRLILEDTGLIESAPQHEWKSLGKVHLPVYAFHALMGDADLDYTGSELDNLFCHYTHLSVPPLEQWQTLEELIIYHLINLKMQHTKGEPYWLIGWSSGGLIAQLVAKQLRLEGERVFVMLLDTWHPALIQALSPAKHAKMLLEVSEKFKKVIYNDLQLPADYRIKLPTVQELTAYGNHTQQAEELFKILIEELQNNIPVVSNLSEELTKRSNRGWQLLKCAQKLLLAELHAENIDVHLSTDDILVQSSDSKSTWGDGLGWIVTNSHSEETNVTDKLQTIKDSSHFTLLTNSLLSALVNGWIKTRLIDLKLPYYEAVGVLAGNKEPFALSETDANIVLSKLSSTLEQNPNFINAYQLRSYLYYRLNEYEASEEDEEHIIRLDPKRKAISYLERCDKYAALRQYKIALRNCDQAIEIKSAWSLYVKRCWINFKLTYYEAAVADCSQTISLYSANSTQGPKTDFILARCYFYRGLSYLSLERYQEAIQDFDQVVWLEPSDINGYYNRGLAKFRQGHYEAAIKDYDQAIALNPYDIAAFFNRRAAKIRLGQYAAADEDLNQINKLDPHIETKFRDRGWHSYRHGQYATAIKEFNMAIFFNPHRASTFYDRGLAKYWLNQYAAAIDDFNQAIIVDSTAEVAFCEQSLVRHPLNQCVVFIDDLNQAIMPNPSDAPLFHDRGWKKYRQGQYAAAIEDFNQAIDLNPISTASYYYRGLAKYRQSEYVTAIEDFSQAIKRDPLFRGAYNGRGLAKDKLGQHITATEDFNHAIKLSPPPDAAAMFHDHGHNKYLQGQYAEAIKDFDQAIILYPGNQASYYYRGLAKERLGQPTAAIEDFNQVIKLDPDFAQVYRDLGWVKSQLGHYETAIEAFNYAIKLDPYDASAYHNRGAAKYYLGQYMTAIEDFDQAIKYHPLLATTYHYRGRAKSQLKQYAAAIADFDQAIKLDPYFVSALNDRGWMKYLLKQYITAIEDFDQAIKFDSFGKAYDRQLSKYQGDQRAPVTTAQNSAIVSYLPYLGLAVMYRNRGYAKSELGQYAAAIEDYNQVIKLDPQAAPYFNRGFAKSQLGHYAVAIEDFNQALILNPNDVSLYAYRGSAKFQLNQYAAAIEDFDQAIKLDPYFAIVFNNRGLAKERLGQYEAAIADYGQAIMLDPQAAIAYRNRGSVKFQLGHYAAAIEDTNQAIILDPQDATAYHNRGSAKLKLDQYVEAIKDFDKAITINPRFLQAYYGRGIAKRKFGQYVAAIKDFNQAIILNPNDASLYRSLEKAKLQLEQTKKITPDFSQVSSPNPNYFTRSDQFALFKQELCHINEVNSAKVAAKHQEQITGLDESVNLKKENNNNRIYEIQNNAGFPFSKERIPQDLVQAPIDKTENIEILHICYNTFLKNAASIGNTYALACQGKDYDTYVFHKGSENTALLPMYQQISTSYYLKSDIFDLSTCKSVEFYNRSSVYCEGKNSTLIYTPYLPQMFENLSVNIMLLVMLIYNINQIRQCKDSTLPRTLLSARSYRYHIQHGQKRLVELVELFKTPQEKLPLSIQDLQDDFEDLKNKGYATREEIYCFIEQVDEVKVHLKHELNWHEDTMPFFATNHTHNKSLLLDNPYNFFQNSKFSPASDKTNSLSTKTNVQLYQPNKP